MSDLPVFGGKNVDIEAKGDYVHVLDATKLPAKIVAEGLLKAAMNLPRGTVTKLRFTERVGENSFVTEVGALGPRCGYTDVYSWVTRRRNEPFLVLPKNGEHFTRQSVITGITLQQLRNTVSVAEEFATDKGPSLELNTNSKKLKGLR